MRMFVDPSDIYLHLDAVDFRKSINGLVVIVEQQVELSPFIDAMFIFSNKKRGKLKILYWDKTGFALWYKRLEKQRFKWPKDDQISHTVLLSKNSLVPVAKATQVRTSCLMRRKPRLSRLTLSLCKKRLNTPVTNLSLNVSHCQEFTS